VVNRDAGAIEKNGTPWNAGLELIAKMSDAEYPDGVPILNMAVMADSSEARKPLVDRTMDLAVVIPENFSRILMEYRMGNIPPPATMSSLGDPANPRYIAAAAYCDYISYEFASTVTDQKDPLEIRVESVGGTKSLNDFDLYVPALLALALMMLMFTTAASIIKEKDKGTWIRLQMSKMRVYEFLSAIGLTQVIIGVLAMGLTFLTAWALGYRTAGSWSAVMAVGLLSSVSVIAVSLVVAAYLRTIFDLLTVGCFPFFILMFFFRGNDSSPPAESLLRRRPIGKRERYPADDPCHCGAEQDLELRFGIGRSESRNGFHPGSDGGLLRDRDRGLQSPSPQGAVMR
jgi:ABC-2 type transport system permease protein